MKSDVREFYLVGEGMDDVMAYEVVEGDADSVRELLEADVTAVIVSEEKLQHLQILLQGIDVITSLRSIEPHEVFLSLREEGENRVGGVCVVSMVRL